MMSPRVAIRQQFNRLDNKQIRHELVEDFDIHSGYYFHNKTLGEGGFGKVRLATHLKTGQRVAVKIMNKLKLGADLFRVHIEINALKALNHENIAKLLQVIETEDQIYLVLEYCSGGELFDYLVTNYSLSEDETKIIIRDLAKVLTFIHENGFAHRDLKPENILFDENHRIKLIDFGLAANCRDFNISLSHLSTCCGSPAYAAPELLGGGGYSGPAVDVWSTGVLLYALLVGRLPFDSENIGLLYKKIQSGVYYLPQFLSLEVRDLIKSMLKTDPKERITVNEMLSHPWLSVSEERTTLRSRRPSFDEVFWICHDLFPETPLNELKQNILTGFGYQTATYWLIKNNPNIIPTLKPSGLQTIAIEINSVNKVSANRVQRRLSKSFDNSSENNTRPKIVGFKRKMNECETIKEHQIKKSPLNEYQVKDMKVSDSVQKENNQFSHTLHSKIPVLKTYAKSTPKPKDSIKLAKAKSPNTTPNKKTHVLCGLKASPFLTERNNNSQFSASFSSKSPAIEKTDLTPKKSLLKRLLETATPSKSQTPRTITASTDPKNITLTKFIDPQQCIDKLVETLKARGIQCKQKFFTLRCVMSAQNVIILSFNLEICKFDNLCVIQRKRLKGNAWDYKRVCEEILRISNE